MDLGQNPKLLTTLKFPKIPNSQPILQIKKHLVTRNSLEAFFFPRQGFHLRSSKVFQLPRLVSSISSRLFNNICGCLSMGPFHSWSPKDLQLFNQFQAWISWSLSIAWIKFQSMFIYSIMNKLLLIAYFDELQVISLQD